MNSDYVKVGRRLSVSVFSISLILLGGCQLLPESQSSRVDEAVVFPEEFESNGMVSLEVAESLLALFQSETLEELMEKAYEHNPDLLASYARLEEAGFNLAKARGGFWPSLTGGGKASRSGGNSLSTTRAYEAGLDASWEIDVWGSIRNSAKASAADLAVAEANYDAARQSLAAQVTQGWFDVIKESKLLDLAQRRRESFESTERLVERRYEAGTGSLADLELARTDAANARADFFSSYSSQGDALRALKVLVGEYPDQSFVTTYDWPSLDRGVPAGLPVELLEARPDVRAALSSVDAADARTKVAFADLFPSFVLTGSGGRSSDRLSDLGRSAFDVWSLAGDLSGPVFQGGALRAELGAAGKRAEQAFQNFRGVLLNALLEVENGLNAEALLADEQTARLEALDAARRAESRTRRDYEEGLADILTLLETQRRVFSTEEQTINLHAARLNNRVSLALAIGKGV